MKLSFTATSTVCSRKALASAMFLTGPELAIKMDGFALLLRPLTGVLGELVPHMVPLAWPFPGGLGIVA